MEIGKIIKTQDQLSEAIKFCENDKNYEIITLPNGEMVVSRKDFNDKERKLKQMEEETGLTRAIREFITENNLNASEYVLNKVNEMNALAEELRNMDSKPTTETSVESNNESDNIGK